MHPLLQWGLNLIAAIQHNLGGPALDALMRCVTFLGNEFCLLLLAPILIWCVDYTVGVRLGYFVLLSEYVNVVCKDLLRQPRPTDFRPELGRIVQHGYGLPSSHAQITMTLWGSLAVQARKAWVWAASAIIVAAVGFSRLYLGVHFPTDILAGWLLALFLLVVFFKAAPALEAWLSRNSLAWQIALALTVPVILVLLHPVKDAVASLAPLAGLGAGAAIFRRTHTFNAGGPWILRLLRYLAGIIVLVGLYYGLSIAIPKEGEALYMPLRFLRYALLGLWVSLGAPLVFIKLGLVKRV